MTEVTDRKQIAINYLKTWFFIDLISIFPIDHAIKFFMDDGGQSGQAADHNGDLNLLLRMAKMGKIYKLIRLVRLVKLFKILKNRENLTAQFSKSLEINAG